MRKSVIGRKYLNCTPQAENEHASGFKPNKRPGLLAPRTDVISYHTTTVLHPISRRVSVNHAKELDMSAAAGRTASKVGQAVGKAASKANAAANETAGAGRGKDGALQKGAKRDPELYVSLSSSRLGLPTSSSEQGYRYSSPS